MKRGSDSSESVDGPSIALVAADPVVCSRVSYYRAEHSISARLTTFDSVAALVSAIIGELPGNTKHLPDLAVMPAAAIPELPRIGVIPVLPKILYGDVSFLPAAFLYGAFDYLRDPWGPEELWLRSERLVAGLILRFPWGELRAGWRSVSGPRGSITLAIPEYALLRALSRFPREAVSRDELAVAISGRGIDQSRAVDVHISRLRAKLRRIVPPGVPEVILTVRGEGYALAE